MFQILPKYGKKRKKKGFGRNMKEKEEIRLENLKEYENDLHSEYGIEYICGIDEAGRGPLAGPVAVGAVIMPKNSFIEGVNDSKKISEKKREKLYEEIKNEAIAWNVVMLDEKEIDELNILNATKKALTMAIAGLQVKPERILVDALENIDTLGIPYTSIIKGDAKVYSISCASILAKVTRDRYMQEMDKKYPGYGFAKHKGYGTAQHIKAIKESGICEIHRKTFVKNFVNDTKK